MAQRRRPYEVKFHVDEAELQIIRRKMAQVGTNCMASYLRKMALDGHILRLELPELREMISLLRRTSNNANQIARRVNATGRIYDTDTEEIRQSIAEPVIQRSSCRSTSRTLSSTRRQKRLLTSWA